MGFFDFLKPKQQEPEPINLNALFLSKLMNEIKKMGYEVEMSNEYAAIIVNKDIEIASAQMPGDFHPSLLPIIAICIHKNYFPDGIETSVVGLGNSDEVKVKSAVDNYITSTFNTIIESFSDTHIEEFDFKTTINKQEILWHPKMSDNFFQGNWDEADKQTNLYSLYEQKIKEKLTNKKFHWLKLYVARQADGEITSECLLNNENWEEGRNILINYAKTWSKNKEFLGHKQFIMFRRCDSFD